MCSWERFNELFDEMKPYINAGDWQGLERHYARIATRMSGTEPQSAVDSVDLFDYEESLRKMLERALKLIGAINGIAMYFEYDIDNDWHSNIFLCKQYRPESDEDDDWACSWKEDIEGPDLPVFTEIYEKFGGFDVDNDAQVVVTLYLIARTTASFGRALESLSPPNIVVCIGYHDQDPITRIHEPVRAWDNKHPL